MYLKIEGIKALARQRGWRVAFRYVPRERNAVPDDMCRRAREAGQGVEYENGVVPQDAPEVKLGDLYRVVDEMASGRR